MGKGKGAFKRWCTIVYPGRVFIEHINAPLKEYKRYLIKMQLKTKLFLKIISRSTTTIKYATITSGLSKNSNKLQFVRLRKQILLVDKHLKF